MSVLGYDSLDNTGAGEMFSPGQDTLAPAEHHLVSNCNLVIGSRGAS